MIRLEPLTLRVRQVEALSPTLKRLMLESADGGLLPTSLPGAHLSLALQGGDRVFRNSYSIVSHHDERRFYEVIVRRTALSRGGSAFVHEAIRQGHVLRSAVPSSLFPIQSKARKHLLIGGGIGITPLLSFLPALRERGERLELHQFAAIGEMAVFEDLLRPFASHDIHVHAGRSARPLRELLSRQPLGTHVYSCGPQSLMDAIEQTASELGWPASRIHRENFGAAGGTPFTVRLGRQGRDVAVGEDDTMLAALEDAGVEIASLCRGGACGACLTHVTAGEPEHRDHFLTAEERARGDMVMPCVSRSKSPMLTLDL